jgi:phospho-N-acetylmuramoyl-pentapeptide-transferase
LIALLIGGPFIRLFSKQENFNPIRVDGPTDHIIKKIGTPTMGGVINFIGLIVSVIIWADLTNI